jgi:hypothetical protein
VDQEEPSQELLGVNICEVQENYSFCPKQRKAPVHTTPLGFSLYNCFYVLDCALKLQEFNETLVAVRTPLQAHFVYPYERKNAIVCYA